ncbi:hypothetical protein IED13_01105 [Bosea sp. SSUT16]|uniref:Uncharacterized protein n=1 Tax=Bosea spartocytisi TaxID=2773451 RepID=A0A927E4Z9_9HYPH|nr:hypothetical protein [Bosea spartocytisi]MBD3844277.1 hypothetical protein [Bosea spartocytisi]MCT4470617.1 hypothetical protein [Bosea spartocytisi]
MAPVNMRVNDDGKFFGRVVAAFAGAVPVLLFGGVLWWSDARNADKQSAESITRIEKRMDAVEEAQRKQAEQAAADRQKLAELNTTVQSMNKTTDRIDRRLETLYDRLVGGPASRP